MVETLSPLEWTMPPIRPAAPAAASAAAEVADAGPEVFVWPNPPLACYPVAAPQTEPLACEIVGLDGSRRSGRLTLFVPEQEVALVQVPPARTTMALRFDQFQSLTLTPTLAAVAPRAGDPHSGLLGQRASTIFRVDLKGGGELAGTTVGHVETEFGLFLFLPVGDDGKVRRQFVPHAVFDHFEVGARIGEVLVEHGHATTQQVGTALETQRQLRARKLGEQLVSRDVVSPDQLLAAIARQGTMPMVRIGEALISLHMISQAQLEEALAQQRADRGVPLGEVLVRMGVVTRTDLQVALARRMGYPLVDIDAFPLEAEALRKLGYTAALRLRVMPLLVRDGRLIVALRDVEHRRTAVREIEFIA